MRKIGGIEMKTGVIDIKQRAKKLALISKQKGLIKPHTEAFKDFPVSQEIHKGKDVK